MNKSNAIMTRKFNLSSPDSTFLFIVSIFILLLCSCEKSPSTQTTPLTITISDNQVKPILISHLLEPKLSDLLNHAEQLEHKIQSFLDNPTETNLHLAKAQWYQAYKSLTPVNFSLEFGQHYPDLFPGLEALRARLDPWPIEAGFVDKVPGYPQSGLIHAISVEISPANILKQHQLSSEEEALLGFQVIAFLLWGNNGDRSVKDFAANTIQLSNSQLSEGLTKEDHSTFRRRQLLKLAIYQLISDIKILQSQWNTDGQYLKTWLSLEPDYQQQILLSGVKNVLTKIHWEWQQQQNKPVLSYQRSPAYHSQFFIWTQLLLTNSNLLKLVKMPIVAEKCQHLALVINQYSETELDSFTRGKHDQNTDDKNTIENQPKPGDFEEKANETSASSNNNQSPIEDKKVVLLSLYETATEQLYSIYQSIPSHAKNTFSSPK